MSLHSDISSTERLLDLIRRKKDGVPASEQSVRDEPTTGISIKSYSQKALPFQKTNTVGVEIGHDYLRMVMAAKSDNKWKLPAVKKTPIPTGLSRDSNDFVQLLKRELTAFLGAKKHKIWVVALSSQVDIRHIRIPKVQKKQIEDVVYWSVKKDFPFDEKESILDFEVLGEVVDQGIAKVSVMVYIAPRQVAENLKSLFSRAGYSLAGITITPLAIQTLFRTGWITNAGESVACLHVGFSYSRIDIFARGCLMMTRDIKTGTNSMVESFVDTYNDKIRPSLPGSAEAIGMEEARKIVYSLSSESPPLSEGDKGYGLQSEEIFDMLQSVLERLVRQVERTFEYFAGNLGHEKVIKIYVSGAIDANMKLVTYIGGQLGIDAEALDPLGEQAPPYYKDGRYLSSVSERMGYAPALGLALADEALTPNLLFTYRDKEKAASITRINKNIFLVFIAAVLICAGVFFYQQHAIAQKKALIAVMERELSQFSPPVSMAAVMEAAARSSQRQTSARDIRSRYLGMAIISELCAMTSPSIQFIRLSLNLSPARAETRQNQAGNPPKKAPALRAEEIIEIEGLVTGARDVSETILAGYAMALENSPMFMQVAVQKSSVEQLKNEDALHFVIRMKVE
ncbi:MAG: hypothetical protein C0394_00630 [Syntrophus sp. (in: bacteria)]|nr:hypothetical protein [Syntrophus sp. (in: bacteria)]